METESADTGNEESPLRSREVTTILVLVDTPEFETEPQTSQQSTLNSKLAKAVDKVLTNKVLVKRLDTLRTMIKTTCNNTEQ